MLATKAFRAVVISIAVAQAGLAQQAGEPAANTDTPRPQIVVDRTCRILPDSDARVLGDDGHGMRDPIICHLESIFQSQHVEEKIADGEHQYSRVRIAEQEYVLQDVIEAPVVFLVRHPVPEGWTVDSDPQPVSVDAGVAVFRVFADPGQTVRLHVGLRHATPIDDAAPQSAPNR
jgi:hypothetical protein